MASATEGFGNFNPRPSKVGATSGGNPRFPPRKVGATVILLLLGRKGFNPRPPRRYLVTPLVSILAHLERWALLWLGLSVDRWALPSTC